MEGSKGELKRKVGRGIKHHRLQRGLTQEQLANKCGVATMTIRRYESGIWSPNVEVLDSILDALQITSGDIITGAEGQTKVFYKCDGKACKDGCTGRGCRHTADIEHAVNFEKIVGGAYWEIDEEERTERRKYTTEEMQEAVKKAAEEIGNKLREGFPITEGKNCDKSEGKYIYKICGEIYIDSEDTEDGVLDYIEMCVDKAVKGSIFDGISYSIYKYDNCAYITITAGEAESLYLIAIELKERIGIEFEYGKVKLSPHQFES